MCGEYLNPELHPLNQLGSPPHAWRILQCSRLQGSLYGITSTYVENTKRHKVRIPNPEDHLHIRGEYRHHRRCSTRQLGSPPHTWRIQLGVINTKLNQGITSTYVENTYRI